MTGKSFVDANILIYAYDISDKVKRGIAKGLLEELWTNRLGILSPQVLQEFYVNATRKIAKPLSRRDARLIVNDYALWSVDVGASDVAAAFRIEDDAKIGFWDALIVATASRAGAERLLSEDLNAGQSIDGVTIENPFRD